MNKDDIHERHERTLKAEQPAHQEQGDSICQENDGCPTERAVLQRFWRGQSIPDEHYPAWFKPAQHDRVRELECVIADLKAECKELRAQPVAEAMARYLRVCSSGGMPKELRESVQSLVEDEERLGYFKASQKPEQNNTKGQV